MRYPGFLRQFLTVFCWLQLATVQAQQTPVNQVAGIYQLEGVMETAAGLQLKPDHTFEYGFVYGAADKWASGTWKLNGNSVILNSKNLQPASDFILKKSDSRHKQGIKIKITDEKGLPYSYVKCKLGNEEATTNTQGEALFRNIHDGKLQLFHPIYSLRVSALQLNLKHNNFIIYPAGNLAEVHLKAFRLEIKPNALEATNLPGMPPEDAAGRLKRYVFRRQN